MGYRKWNIVVLVLGILGGSANMMQAEASDYLPRAGAELLKEQYEKEMIVRKQEKKEEQMEIKIAKVTVDVLNIRKGRGTDTEIIGQLAKGERREIKKEAEDGWIKIQYKGGEGFVSDKYVEIEKRIIPIESKENVLDKGTEVAEYACKFIGNPYVWGGTSLTDGADCSGFVQSIYKNFGVELPRTTWDMEHIGREVNYEESMPGDLILYDGHVGIYIGGDQIVNAIDEQNGIGISSALSMEVITVRRIL